MNTPELRSQSGPCAWQARGGTRWPTLLCAVALLTLALPAPAADLIKSPNDPRDYRALVLDNRLKVILVSDPDTDMAAASLSVDVGSQANPTDREGLAHFLEHMLFLGTGKYPQPGEYKDFVSRNGGSDNAYTSGDETNYFFEVKAQALEETLDRFARFFIDPLFTAAYVDRERQVVESEYLGRKKSDGRRTWSATRTVLNPGHPASQFAVGNLETLGDRPGSNVRDELIDFYDRYYSANLMALTVVGRESLDILEGWVRSRFSAIPDRDAVRPVSSEPLFPPGRLPAWLDVVPEKEQRLLRLTFPIPAIREHWRSKPSAHVGHLLGHEGDGSLLAELKRRGWAQSLSAGPGYSDDHQATFNLSVQLTPEGLTRTDDIIALVFQAVALVREQGLQAWIFDENRRLGEIGFQFQEKAGPVRLARRLSSLQHTLPQRDVLRAGYAFETFRPALIRAILDRLTPDNMLVTRVAPGLATDATTRWYDAPYRVAAVTPEQRTAWQTAPDDVGLALPARNPFIPDELAVQEPEQPSAVPVAVDERPGFTLWHQHDASYRLPKADLFVSVRSPQANGSPRQHLLTGLYIDLVNDALDSFAYPADLAGLTFSLYPHLRGFSVRISGYDQRQPVLLQRILRTLTQFRVDPARFEILRAERKRRLLNARLDQPYAQAMRRLRALIIEPRWSVAEQLAVVDTLTPRQLEDFVPRLLQQVEVVALSHGNVGRETALALGETVHAALVAPARPTSVKRAQVRKLRRGDRLGVDLAMDHPESALVMYLQGPDASLASRAHAGMLAQILSSPFFDRLRTERKLGYVVFANAFPVLDTAGLVFIAQSPIADAATLAQEMRDFLDEYVAALANMPAGELAQHRRALVARILEEERQLGDRSNRYWDEIDRGNARFDTREQLVADVEAVSASSLTAFYRKVVASEIRRQLVIAARGEKGGKSVAPRGSVTAEQLRSERGLIPG
jgi:secreted Zn-dependent insulinase-like peptidase